MQHLWSGDGSHANAIIVKGQEETPAPSLLYQAIKARSHATPAKRLLKNLMAAVAADSMRHTMPHADLMAAVERTRAEMAQWRTTRNC